MDTLGRQAQQWLHDTCSVLQETLVTDAAGTALTLEQGMQQAVDLLVRASDAGGTLFLIGNGGSAGTASHLAADFWKLAGMRAMAFNDPSLLTCLGNDLGFERVFDAPLRMFARPGDVVIAISCSGRSPNVVEAVGAARELGCEVVGFSGFDRDNPLRGMGALNFYVPSPRYGPVEVAHLALVHAVLDVCAARHAERQAAPTADPNVRR